MIYIESVTLQHFRGAKSLNLKPERKNFAVGGNNGTGKSGVVDGVEFALTGNITRLTGKGAGSLSLKTHGPHVDMRDQPEKAAVILVAFVPSLKKTITIERRIHAPKEVVLTPNDSDAQAVLAKLGNHPEFALSRREILKYILTEPSERSKAVQALLKLDEVDRVRASFQSISNSCKSETKKQDLETQRAKGRLLEALGIEELKTDLILESVNERRKTLNLIPLVDMNKDTSLKDGLASGAGVPKSKVVKSVALVDLANIKNAIETPEPEAILSAVQRISEIYAELQAHPAMLRNLKQRSFLKSGLDLISEDECPLCEVEWDAAELRDRLKQKLAEAVTTEKLKTELDSKVLVICDASLALAELVRAAAGYSKQLDAKEDAAALAKWETSLRSLEATLTSLDNIVSNQKLLAGGWRQVSADTTGIIRSLKEKCDALPDASKEDEARDYLVLAQERLEVYRKALRQHKMWKDRADLAAQAVVHYGAASNGVLGTIYEEVQKDFTRYYQIINQDDEANFKGRLSPSTGKLGFEVDFYGRGFQHPAAYHSEGHQDGMGLCLYLALMKRVLGNEFTFAVLDDVLTSVDAGHRKEVCKLLKTEFSTTQFLITTHEEVWLQHMITSKLVTNKAVVRFRKWTVDDGPMVWDQKEVWSEIADDLDQGNVPSASHSLRRYLEYIAHELSDKLRVTVEYRSSGYELGDLLPAVTSRLGFYFTRAKEAAQSWKQTTQFERIRGMHDNFKRKLEQSQVEQWAINKTVHYNQWAQLQKQDFQPVVDSFKDLLSCFKCAGCDCYFYVSPMKGPAEILRCDCGDANFNLKNNPDAAGSSRL